MSHLLISFSAPVKSEEDLAARRLSDKQGSREYKKQLAYHHGELLRGLERIQERAEDMQQSAGGQIKLAWRMPIRHLLNDMKESQPDSMIVQKYLQELDMEEHSIRDMAFRNRKNVQAANDRGAITDLSPTRQLMQRWVQPLAREIQELQRLCKVAGRFTKRAVADALQDRLAEEQEGLQEGTLAHEAMSEGDLPLDGLPMQGAAAWDQEEETPSVKDPIAWEDWNERKRNQLIYSGKMIQGINPEELAGVVLHAVMGNLLVDQSRDLHKDNRSTGANHKMYEGYGKQGTMFLCMHVGRIVNEQLLLSKAEERIQQHNEWRKQVRALFRQLETAESRIEDPKKWNRNKKRRKVVEAIQAKMQERQDLAKVELLDVGSNDAYWSDKFWASKNPTMYKRKSMNGRPIHAKYRRRPEYLAQMAREIPWTTETRIKVGAVLVAMLINSATIPVPMKRSTRAAAVFEGHGSPAAEDGQEGYTTLNDTEEWGGGLKLYGEKEKSFFEEHAEAQREMSDGLETQDYVEVLRPAFRRIVQVIGFKDKRGYVEAHNAVLEKFNVLHGAQELFINRLMPMVIPPVPWTRPYGGGYLLWNSGVIRAHTKQQRTHLDDLHRRHDQPGADQPQIMQLYEALNALGEQGWRINKPVLAVIEAAWGLGGGFADLPTLLPQKIDVPVSKSPRFRTISSPGQLLLTMTSAESSNERWYRRYRTQQARKVEREQHSLRCDLEIKLNVARQVKDEECIYYPHNCDFRGRAYPMHLHMNHMSNDMCRSLLQFSDGRPLGPNGLHWLYVQLANSFGNGEDKKSFDDRHCFVVDNLDKVLHCATNPLADNPDSRWWLEADEPWQFLAHCMEVANAHASGCPEEFVSHHPVQLDGSCNGLQHYAALGRDFNGGAAVNLLASDKPQDVYTMLANRVRKEVQLDIDTRGEHSRERILNTRKQFEAQDEDNELTRKRKQRQLQQKLMQVSAADIHENARLILPHVDRKLVKQTVMTSVYGVTHQGARSQISNRLRERGVDAESDDFFSASNYATQITMLELGNMFVSARAVMAWLNACAGVIARGYRPKGQRGKKQDDNDVVKPAHVTWTNPMGLPVMQPYSNKKRKEVMTFLQVANIQGDGPVLSIAKQRQRSAFPPNYIHSIDSSHMMLTAIACKNAGLAFAGVHDSFWTHAATTDEMNRILRETFVELHSRPLLENLHNQFTAEHPQLAQHFPKLPKIPDPALNLEDVRDSPYFFS
ncbi:hypothetical protein WJX73_001423 [Symbiochloris irregularis]|uniref:DNA-directed RNA polymerase n=1 Tax=Symbiochloris irregularis TaxID=706552 RepID=A0AAW1PGX1_9CHLO